MSDERDEDPAQEPEEGTEEPALPDPRGDPAGALDALEERVLGASRDRFEHNSDDEDDEDEAIQSEPDPRPDEPPS
jgi:hypothetical protein